MGLFSRKQRSSPSAPAPVAYAPVGRKLRSDGTLAEAEANFRGLAVEESTLRSEGVFFMPVWLGTDPNPPDLLLGAWLTPTTAIYVAGWDLGSHRELHVVPPDYEPPGPDATRHFPIFGAWKMRDRSIASIGGVTQFPVADQ